MCALLYVTINITILQIKNRVINLKIGICVQFDDIGAMSKKFDNLKSEGFDSCQLVSWHPELWKDENAELINSLISERGITVSAFWCGWEGPRVWNFY